MLIIKKLTIVWLGILSLISVTHSMEIDNDDSGPNPNKRKRGMLVRSNACGDFTSLFCDPNKQEQGMLVRSNACRDFTPLFDKLKILPELTIKRSPKIVFPAHMEALSQAIQEGCTNIWIYIPRNADMKSNSLKVDFSIDHIPDLSGITSFIINHSASESRGYWKAAVKALIPLVSGSPKLKTITLSALIAEEFLPYIPYGTEVQLDCGYYYKQSDTLNPSKTLEVYAKNALSYFQSQYLGFQFYLVPFPIPFKRARFDSDRLDDQGTFMPDGS